ncbi:hypothetical protein HRbin29_01777 [bacterium HR29]|jgi:uncharacterized protein (DUF2249 family)|nr:hypothetical protein HRbin29_01777 [bacterium HR29]
MTARFVTLDVREDLRQGREPFPRIMAAVRNLGPDEGLELYATFEPRPLYGVMAELGFDAAAEPLPEGDWRVRFVRRPAGAEPAG